MRFVVLAPGESMSQGLADSLRGEHAVVVSTAYKLAPWADALASMDGRWWRVYADAHEFAGRKFSARAIQGVEKVDDTRVPTSSSSGVLGIEVAKLLGATEIHLYGFDNRGTHFHGPHPPQLSRTAASRFREFDYQFADWARRNRDVRVINRTPGSAITAFPFE